jgi:hypothetical protein
MGAPLLQKEMLESLNDLVHMADKASQIIEALLLLSTVGIGGCSASPYLCTRL